MSRNYQMELRIADHDPQRADAIKGAATQHWRFLDWEEYTADDDACELMCSADGSLCGGESEEVFVERLTMAIWRANGGYCEVVVTAAYLDNPPCEEYQLDESDYERLLGNDEGNRK